MSYLYFALSFTLTCEAIKASTRSEGMDLDGTCRVNDHSQTSPLVNADIGTVAKYFLDEFRHGQIRLLSLGTKHCQGDITPHQCGVIKICEG